MRLETAVITADMSSDEQMDKECPLCMEPFDLDDARFFPCTCRYQICRFCWHRLRTDENGLCPACRQQYPDDPVTFQPLSAADLPKLKPEKKKNRTKTANVAECRKHLSAYRVLTKNLVYVIGLPERIALPETLKKTEFFGRFGRIVRVAVGQTPVVNNQPVSFTAYVTYEKEHDALRAIQAVNNLVIDGRVLKASLGTTKYCVKFLSGQPCHKQARNFKEPDNECMFLHEVADPELSFTKEDMGHGKHAEYERKLHEQMTTDLKAAEQAKKRAQAKHPSPEPSSLAKTSGKAEKSSSSSSVKSKTDSTAPSGGGGTSQNISHQYSSDTASDRSRSASRARETSPAGSDCGDTRSDASPPNSLLTSAQFAATSGSRPPSGSVAPPPHVAEAPSEQPPAPRQPIVAPPPGIPVSSAQLTSPKVVSYGGLDMEDDELGFDPISESNKALLDLLEEEKCSPKDKASRDPLFDRVHHDPQTEDSAHTVGFPFVLRENDLHSQSAPSLAEAFERLRLPLQQTSSDSSTKSFLERLRNTPPGLFPNPMDRHSAAAASGAAPERPSVSRLQQYAQSNSHRQQMQQPQQMPPDLSSIFGSANISHPPPPPFGTSPFDGVGRGGLQDGHHGSLNLDRFSPPSIGSSLAQFRGLSEQSSQPPLGGSGGPFGSRLPHVQSFPQEMQRNQHQAPGHHHQQQQPQQHQMPGQNGSVNVEEWRASFKALLPNVNVRFVEDSSQFSSSIFSSGADPERPPMRTPAQAQHSSQLFDSAALNPFHMPRRDTTAPQHHHFGFGGSGSAAEKQQQQSPFAAFHQQMQHHQSQWSQQQPPPQRSAGSSAAPQRAAAADCWISPPPGFPALH